MADLQFFLTDATLWVSFFFSLMIFSMIFGDNFLSRLAQYMLVGIAIGYLGALVIQHVLRPRLFEPLFYSPVATLVVAPQLWVVFGLGVLMVAAGIERILAQRSQAAQRQPVTRLQQWLRGAGIIPAALMLGVGIAVVFIGIMQGTFWPLFWHTAQSGLNWADSVSLALSSVLILLLTTATLLVWTAPVGQITRGQPTWVRYLLQWWVAIGKRALWFAGGVLVARILASQLSLLIARLTFFLEGLRQSGLWQWAALIWRGIGGT